MIHLRKPRERGEERRGEERKGEQRRREENRGEERQHKHTDMSTREILRCEKRTYFTLS
jgi:hypothetical protein